jgi:hypothetical protein
MRKGMHHLYDDIDKKNYESPDKYEEFNWGVCWYI